MMRSLFSGVSGLRVHQTGMDVIGNNISNVNTIGFKSARVTFTEVFNQTLSGASGASNTTGRGGTNPMQVGLGANIASIDNIMTEGASMRTDSPLDLKINGDGFFIVGDGNGVRFTRAGSFGLDHRGNVVGSGGLILHGWYADPNTNEIVRDRVQPLQIDIKDLYAPEATTKVAFQGNLNKNDGVVPMRMSFYDTLGNKYTLQMNAVYDANTSAWSVSSISSVTDAKGNEVQKDGTNVANQITALVGETGTAAALTDTNRLWINFDTNGNIRGLNTGNAPNDSEITTLNFQFPNGGGTSFDGVNSTVGDGQFRITMDFGPSQPGDPLKRMGLTQYNQETTLDSAEPLDGYEPGAMTGFNIGSDGKILAKYSNGAQKILGQIALAIFRNPAGLEKIGDGLFDVTPNSGGFDGIGVDPTAGGGSLSGGVLEMSNVDLAKEFTNMIMIQRGFQANSRVISSSDEMLQELANLKR